MCLQVILHPETAKFLNLNFISNLWQILWQEYKILISILLVLPPDHFNIFRRRKEVLKLAKGVVFKSWRKKTHDIHKFQNRNWYYSLFKYIISITCDKEENMYFRTKKTPHKTKSKQLSSIEHKPVGMKFLIVAQMKKSTIEIEEIRRQ